MIKNLLFLKSVIATIVQKALKNICLEEGVESDPHQKMIHMGKSESDRHIRKVIHIQIGKVIAIYYLVNFHDTHQTSIRLLQTPK